MTAARFALVACALVGCQPAPPSPPVGPTAPAQPATPAPAPEGPALAEETLTVGCCRALVLSPPGARRSERLPLVVALHGLGDSAAGYAEVMRGLLLRARVVVLDGIDPWPGGGGGRQWFALGSLDTAPAGFVRAVDAVAATLGALTQRLPTCGLPVVTGFSQGAMLSYALAARSPAVVRAAVPIAGRVPVGLLPGAGQRQGSGVRVRGLHGDADARVSMEDGQATVEALRAAGIDAYLDVALRTGHTLSPGLRSGMFRQLMLLAPCP